MLFNSGEVKFLKDYRYVYMENRECVPFVRSIELEVN